MAGHLGTSRDILGQLRSHGPHPVVDPDCFARAQRASAHHPAPRQWFDRARTRREGGRGRFARRPGGLHRGCAACDVQPSMDARPDLRARATRWHAIHGVPPGAAVPNRTRLPFHVRAFEVRTVAKITRSTTVRANAAADGCSPYLCRGPASSAGSAVFGVELLDGWVVRGRGRGEGCGARGRPALFRSTILGWFRVGDMMVDGGKRRDKPAWSRR